MHTNNDSCMWSAGEIKSVLKKAWFSYVGKIPGERGFYFFPTIPDFADISDMRQRSVPDFPDYELTFVIGGLDPSNLGDW